MVGFEGLEGIKKTVATLPQLGGFHGEEPHTHTRTHTQGWFISPNIPKVEVLGASLGVNTKVEPTRPTKDSAYILWCVFCTKTQVFAIGTFWFPSTPEEGTPRPTSLFPEDLEIQGLPFVLVLPSPFFPGILLENLRKRSETADF